MRASVILLARKYRRKGSDRLCLSAYLTFPGSFIGLFEASSRAIELPSDLQVFRSTVVARVSFTKDAELSQKFIDFLTTTEVRKIYSDYGWIHAHK